MLAAADIVAAGDTKTSLAGSRQSSGVAVAAEATAAWATLTEGAAAAVEASAAGGAAAAVTAAASEEEAAVEAAAAEEAAAAVL